jgi:glycosyltransferase involved in cell wall biosynthesis
MLRFLRCLGLLSSRSIGLVFFMRFTVLTATYNGAHTLGPVYQSLCLQTFHDFEWIIVDDGSTDRTKDLVSSWKPFFPIRYFWKPNGGKHTAMNHGVSTAKGEFVVVLDADDVCIPTALERFDYHWRQIPDSSRFANLSCLCRTPAGAIIGKPFPGDPVDAFTFADQMRFRYSGKWGSNSEGWGITRTDVLREFPYPEGERYAPEALVWNRISRKYAARYINEALRTYEPDPDGITSNVTALRASSPKSTLTYYRELGLSPAPILVRLRAALNYVRFAAIAAKQRLSGFFRAHAKSL